MYFLFVKKLNLCGRFKDFLPFHHYFCNKNIEINLSKVIRVQRRGHKREEEIHLQQTVIYA